MLSNMQLEFHNLCDKPSLLECQRQGIGAKLLKTIAAEAKALELSKIYLYTMDKTAFYVRCGWQVLDHVARGDKMVVILSKAI